MVAYGRPNRFYNNNHRGRKRCGMIFAQPEVRARLDLKSKADYDPDVRAGRLKIGDEELFSFIFARKPEPTLVALKNKTASSLPSTLAVPSESSITGNGGGAAWRIAHERYNHPSTVYIFPDGNKRTGDQIRDWSRIPAGTRVLLSEMEDTQPFEGFLEIGKDGDTPEAVAGTAYTSATTIYFFPDGFVRTGAELKKRKSDRGLLNNPPNGTRVLVGYIYGGHVRTRRSPKSIAGIKWNYPSTYYRFPDGIILSGDDINKKGIPAGTLIFYQR
jgi:N-acetylmuramoyl-L-alanine amidase